MSHLSPTSIAVFTFLLGALLGAVFSHFNGSRIIKRLRRGQETWRTIAILNGSQKKEAEAEALWLRNRLGIKRKEFTSIVELLWGSPPLNRGPKEIRNRFIEMQDVNEGLSQVCRVQNQEIVQLRQRLSLASPDGAMLERVRLECGLSS